MKMLRQLPKLLRFIPGAAQDMRAYFLALQYWLGGSEENLANLVRLLVDRYAAGPRAGLLGRVPASAPIQYPEIGLYHPRAPGRVVDHVDQLPTGGAAGTVGLLLMRSYVLSGNAAHYDGVIAAIEARGLRVIPAFASGLDARPAVDRHFLRDGRPIVDAVVSLTGFSLVGGPAYNDAHAPRAHLAALDVPYARRASGRVPDTGAVGSERARPDADRSHDDGRDPRAGWRHMSDDVRRAVLRRCRWRAAA